MIGAAAALSPAARRALLTICTMTATIMQALDTTIANVALPYMQGSLSASLDQVSDPQSRMFRSFAQQTKSDLKAMAACIRGTRQTLTEAQVGAIKLPVLVAVGTEDDVAGSAEELAALIPGARALPIPGRDHMLSVGDKVFKEGVLDFLNQRA